MAFLPFRSERFPERSHPALSKATAAHVAPAGILAVIKADAYGHGAMACARALAGHVWGFAISLVEEGVELRRGGIDKPIVVLGGVYGRSHQDLIAYRITPVVSEKLIGASSLVNLRLGFMVPPASRQRTSA